MIRNDRGLLTSKGTGTTPEPAAENGRATWRSSLSGGEGDGEGCSFLGGGFDFDAAAVGFDDGFALEHADADAAFFGGLKGAEEGAGEEFGGHAAAIVGDGELHGAVVLPSGNFDGAVFADGVD